MTPVTRLRDAEAKGASAFIVEGAATECLQVMWQDYAPPDPLRGLGVFLAAWGTPKHIVACHDIIDKWLPPIYFDRLRGMLTWIRIGDSLYASNQNRTVILKTLRDHESSAAIQHKIVLIATELLDKGRWSEAKEILKPLFEVT